MKGWRQEQLYREEMGEEAFNRQRIAKPGKQECNCIMRKFPGKVDYPSPFHAYTCPFYRKETTE